MNVLSKGLLVITGCRLFRATSAAQIRHDYGMSFGQLAHHWPPHVTRLGVTMKENNRTALAAHSVVQAHAVNLGVVFGKPWLLPLVWRGPERADQTKDDQPGDQELFSQIRLHGALIMSVCPD